MSNSSYRLRGDPVVQLIACCTTELQGVRSNPNTGCVCGMFHPIVKIIRPDHHICLGSGQSVIYSM